MTYTYEQIVEQYKRLPQDLKEAIDMLDPAGILGEIGQKYVLHNDQIGILADQTAMVIIGFVRPENFVTNLIARLGLDRAVAEGIAREVNEQIFLKIRESLQALHEGNKDNSNYGVEMLPNANPLTPATTLGAGETVPNKKEVIDGIEHPKEAREENVFEQKMGKLFRIPREEVDLDLYNEKPE